MIPKTNKKIYTSLFVHWDLIAKTKLKTKPVKPCSEKLTRPQEISYVLKQEGDKEYPITEELFNTVKEKLKGEMRIGGNAGNASVSLGELSIPSVLSSPIRPKSLMRKLSEYPIKLISNNKETKPVLCSRKDPEFIHIIFEEKNQRKIFTYDPMCEELWLDYDFWPAVKNADLLFLSGFHLVDRKYEKNLKYILDILQERKYKTHLELAHGKKDTHLIIKKLLDYDCVDSLGLNQDELYVLGLKSKSIEDIKLFCSGFMKEYNVQRLCIHTSEYRLVFFRKNPEKNLKASQLSSLVCAAKTTGNIKNLRKASLFGNSEIKPEKGKNYFLLPVKKNPNPKIITGLGDTAGITEFVFSMG